MSALVLVINTGSSSIKYQVVDVEARSSLLSGLVEEVTSYEEGFDEIRAALPDSLELAAIGHRVVHGGPHFSAPVLIDDSVVETIEACVPLAPLHNPANLAGIAVARSLYPSVPQVAVFDTAFHATLPQHAYSYALPPSVGPEVRRYGFHGTSHQYVSREAARFLGRPLESLRLVTLHLGNGASACAVAYGRSVDTSMGMTPLEGLVMGTRTGDLDPAVVLHLLDGRSPADVDRLLNRESGLRGMAGTNDVRRLILLAADGHAGASAAIRLYCYRIRKYIGAYAAAMDGLDAVVFTAGVGENSAFVRSIVCGNLTAFGIAVDEALNKSPSGDPRSISSADSFTPILVIPTDEEQEIARQSLTLVTASGAE